MTKTAYPMGRCGGLRARRLCSQLAWGILASWMLWALNLQISTRSDRPKTPAILGLMRLNFLSVHGVWLVSVHDHHQIIARIAQSLAWVVLEFGDIDCMHVIPF